MGVIQMKKALLAIALASSLTSFGAVAADKAPEPDFTITGNFGLTSDYRFRGISQSNKSFAVQGGIDFAHKSGFYAGNWNSSVSEWAANDSSGIEQDFYLGYQFNAGPVAVNVGTIYYAYPNGRVSTSNHTNPYNTQEAYLGLTYGDFSVKASRTLTDYYFGLGKSPADTTLTTKAEGTMYYDLTFKRALSEKVSFTAHYGLTSLANKVSGTKDFGDYAIGLNYDLSGWGISATYYNTTGLNSAAKTWYTATDGSSEKLYEGGVAISITKTF